MRNLLIYVSALAALSPSEVISFQHGAAHLRDLLAYPKYEVQFLNDLPIAVTDADNVRDEGLRTPRDWLSVHVSKTQRKRLSGDHDPEPGVDEKLELVQMHLTPPNSELPAEYLCLMPSKNATESQTALAEGRGPGDNMGNQPELDPVQSWNALSHLEGKCLYARQGWFTYSYCHDSHIRQFKEASHTHPHPPGGHEPEEDLRYDAYTLGQSAAHPDSPARRKGYSTLPQKDRHHNAKDRFGHEVTTSGHEGDTGVSFGMNQQNSRYLVQHWKDGTKCDKSGKPREVEVQVHCDMTSTDMIYLIKEMAICQYVLVIHSPHLCSLPGFKPRHVDVDIAGIQCRQVIDDADFDKWIQSKQDEAESRTHFDGFKRLPWKVEKKVPEHPGLAGFGIDNTMFQAVKPQVEAKDNSLPEIDDDSLQLVLQQALKALNDQLQRGGKGQSEDDEMVVLSLEEDDEGRLYLDGQVLKGSQEEAETQAEEDTGTTGSTKRESVAQAVQQYLESRQRQKELESEQDGDADRKHDEL